MLHVSCSTFVLLLFVLRWHVCRVNFARNIFRATNFVTKNIPKFSPKFLSLCSVGQKKSCKIPSKSPTQFSKFPFEKSNKFTDELLQEVRVKFF